MKFIKSKVLKLIRNEFKNYFSLSSEIPKENELKIITRKQMFELGSTHSFLNLYDLYAKEIIEKMNWDKNNTIYQATPTFRVFAPNQHGTSFHNDFAYGHGIKSFTVWSPLTPCTNENTFHVLKPEFKNFQKDIIQSLASSYNDKLEKDLETKTHPVLPKQNEFVIFSSEEIHGSPMNSSNRTRISFDFRITSKDDVTSTKNLSSYASISLNDTVERPQLKNETGKTLKYICGGKSISTSAQHFIIDKVASEYNINIVAQEAEMERYGAPFLINYLNSKIKSKSYDTIIVASSQVLPNDYQSFAKDSKVKIFDALEQKFLLR